MNAYRQQQLCAAALIEQGATAEQIAEVFNWTKSRATPERAAPKQSGTTGRKPRQKRKRKLLRILCRLLK